tara:strand:- start:287 stop:460 length:174 start_codon:yes stop_codon:yes gene_type:complete
MSELNGPDGSRKIARLLNRNPLGNEKRDEMITAAYKCKTWAEVLIRYKEITGYDSDE